MSTMGKFKPTIRLVKVEKLQISIVIKSLKIDLQI
jgi:hypothetical protein